MARPLRLEHPGALWHITNRGVEQRDIYLDEEDRATFLDLFAGAICRYRWRVHQYCLMTNHFHLLSETVEPTLSRGMQQFEGDYADYFNRRHRRSGHLFKGRFDAQLVDGESYLLTVARYIVLNPVRAGMVQAPGDWNWSSYRATAGLEKPPSWLHTRSVLDRFDEWDLANASAMYRGFVAEGIGKSESPWEKLVAGLYLGSEEFIERVKELTRKRDWGAEHLKVQRDVRAIEIESVRAATEHHFGVKLAGRNWRNAQARLAFALLARDHSIATLRAIGQFLTMTPSGVLRLLSRAEALRNSSMAFADQLIELQLVITQAKIKV